MNPVRDLEIIEEELRLKDSEYLNQHLEKLERTVLRGGDKKLKPEYVSASDLIFNVIRLLLLNVCILGLFSPTLEDVGGR